MIYTTIRHNYSGIVRPHDDWLNSPRCEECEENKRSFMGAEIVLANHVHWSDYTLVRIVSRAVYELSRSQNL
jgi:hypothetical protein